MAFDSQMLCYARVNSPIFFFSVYGNVGVELFAFIDRYCFLSYHGLFLLGFTSLDTTKFHPSMHCREIQTMRAVEPIAPIQARICYNISKSFV